MERIEFADFELDLDRRELYRSGGTVGVQPLVLELIAFLATRPGRVVSRDDLLARIWGGISVSEAALERAVSAARRALGDDGGRQAIIRTERGRGYRWCAETRVRAARAQGPGPFVGRTREVDVLDASLAALHAGRGAPVLVCGEPGIGKSRLGQELARRARAGGALVLAGRCPEAEGAPPYWPWTQLLREALRWVPRVGASLSPREAAVLAQAMPELSDRLFDGGDDGDGGARAEPPPLPARAARLRLAEHLRDAWPRLTDTRPTVLLLDDVHRADLDSLELLAALMEPFGTRPLLPVVLYRDAVVEADPERRALLGELARAPGARTLRLSGMASEELAALARLVCGEAPDAAALARLEAATAGNPFYLLQWLRAEPRARDLGLAAAVRDHLGIVGAKCRELLVQAAVFGRRFRAPALGVATQRPTREVVAVLDEAVRARLLETEPDEPGGYRFAHALIAERLRDDLAVTDRAERHARASEALLRAEGDRALSEAAYHAALAAPAGHAETGVRLCLRAAAQARERLAYHEAARLLEEARALQRWLPPDPRHEFEVRLALGEVALQAGELDGARTHFEAAAATARVLSDPAGLARAALGYAGDQDDARPTPRAVGLLEEALAGLPPGEGTLRAEVTGRLAMAVYSVDLARSRALAAEALAMARRLGDADTQAQALRIRLFTGHGPDGVEASEARADELLSLARASGSAVREDQARTFRLAIALERGDRPAVDAEIAACERLTWHTSHPILAFYVGHYRTLQALLDGRLELAERHLEAARGAGRRTGYDVSATLYAIQLWGLRREQGRLGELAPAMRELARDYPNTPWRLALAGYEATAGDPEPGRRALVALEQAGPSALRRDVTWLATLTLAVDLCAALRASGDGGRTPERLAASAASAASELYGLLLPYAGRHAQVGASVLHLGSVDRALGISASLDGRHEEALRWLESAMRLEDSLRAPCAALRSRLALADAQARAGREAEARVLAAEVGAQAGARGWAGLAAEAAAVAC